MKRIISMILVFTFVLTALAGCSGKPADTTTTETKAESAPVETAEPAAQETKAEEPKTEETKPAAETDSAVPTIKLGFIASLSSDGKVSSYFLEIGLQMVQDLLASSGLKANVEFVLRDLGRDSSEMKQRMTELKEAGCVAIISETLDDYGPATAQWASENKIPVLFCPNYSTEMTISNYSDYIFGTGLNAWGFIKVMALEAVGKRGIQNYTYVGKDSAAAVDAENILLYEAQKINPDFKCLASYRLSGADADFATIISTLLSGKEVPQMTLQQEGYTVISFAMQAAMYDFYSASSVWSDVITMPFIVDTLNKAGVYNYEGSYGATPMAWWDPNFDDFCKGFTAKGLEIYGKEYLPLEYSLYLYFAGMALNQALTDCINNGLDYTDGAVLKDALEKVSFEAFGSEHHFRDFDHQLTMPLYFVDAVDGGEEVNHLAVPADKSSVYAAEDYLPSMEEMKLYGEKYLNVNDRF